VQADGVRQLLIEKNNELLELRNADLKDEFSTLGLIIRSSGERLGLYSLENTLLEATNKRKERQLQLEEDINQITEEYEDILRQLLDAQARAEAQRNAEQARLEALKKLQEERNKLIKEEISNIQQLGRVISIDYGEPPILEDLRNVLATLEELESFNTRSFQRLVNETFALSDERGESYRDKIERTKESLQSFRTVIDRFNSIQSRESGGGNRRFGVRFQSLNQDITIADKTLQTLLASLDDLDQDIISNEQFQQLTNLANQLTNYSELLESNLIPQTDEINTAFNGLGQEISNFVEVYGEIPEGFPGFDASKQQLEDLLFENIKLQDTFKGNEEAAREAAQEIVNSFVNVRINLDQSSESVQQLFNELNDVLFKIDDLATDITSQNAAFRQLILDNTDLFVRQFDIQLDLEERLFGEKRRLLFNEQQIREALALQQINLEDFTREEQIAIIEAFYQRQKELRDGNLADELSSSQLFLEGLTETFNALVSTAQAANDAIRISTENRINVVNANEEAALSQIVGDTEEANQKRLEFEEKFEAQRRSITKDATIAQLELSRIQAIANIAEAITRAFTEGPVIGQVLAGVTAAFGAIQVGLITEQISQVRNLASGGLLFGADHESGGIPLGSTGVFAEGGEAVINRNSSTRYRGLLSTINKAGGGRSISSQDVSSERLMEAISKTKDEPIKAYVLEQDITNKQAINQRLKDLSKI